MPIQGSVPSRMFLVPPVRWHLMSGCNIKASMEEMTSHHARLEQELESQEQLSLPWAHVEELVANHHEVASMPSQTTSVLRCLMAMAALASFAVPLLRASKTAVASCGVGQPEKCFV